jgi:signal transduction histidine kinase
MRKFNSDPNGATVVSDVYHAVAQPLTALRCSLDLAVRKPLDANGYRKAIKEAIAAHDRVVEAVNKARQIAEACAKGEKLQCDFSSIVSQTVEDFEPVAHSKQVKVSRLIESDVMIASDESKLRKLLFILLDEALDRCSETHMEVMCTSSPEWVRMTLRYEIGSSLFGDGAMQEDSSCMLRFVLLQSLGARLEEEHSTWNSSFVLTIPK